MGEGAHVCRGPKLADLVEIQAMRSEEKVGVDLTVSDERADE
jgi:hypothetical protein